MSLVPVHEAYTKLKEYMETHELPEDMKPIVALFLDAWPHIADYACCCADDLRSLGWSVVMHRDGDNGKVCWLLMKGSQVVSSVADTDHEALNDIRVQLGLGAQGEK